MQIHHVRILRLALGTSLSMWVSQAIGWDMSFIAPIMTMFVLALPLPAPPFKAGVSLVLALTLSLYGGVFLLLPALLNYPLVGLLLLVLALFWSFYFTARGGSAALGTFATIGVAVSTAVGSVSIDATLLLIKGLSLNTLIGVAFVWIGHLLLPDSMAEDALPRGAQPKPPAVEPPDPAVARWSAFRSLVIVYPISFWFMLSSASTGYVPVMIKVASMGQQATNEGARLAGRSLIASTIIGGVGATIGWNVLKVVPQLGMYAFLVALAGLICGSRIFKGQGMHPQAGTWSYGYLTMLVILGPAAMDAVIGTSANIAFLNRLLMFGLATLYGVVAVYLVDAFRPRLAERRSPSV